MARHKILLGLTTTPESDWRGKVEECKKFNIQEIAIFPTSINYENRKELYGLLEDSPVKSIPHVHMRNDMEKEELDYLVEKFNTKVFNIHPRNNPHPFTKDYGEYVSNIYIENADSIPEIEELEKFGGLCVDFSHWQDEILKGNKKDTSRMEELANRFKVGCSHVSAVGSEIEIVHDTKFPDIVYSGFSKHTLSDLSEMDYVKNFVQYLPELISIELENSFEEQLRVKKYLEELIGEE